MNYLISLAILIILSITIKIVNYFLLKRLTALTKKTATQSDDFLVGTFKGKILPLFYFGAVYAALTHLTLDPTLTKAINFIGLTLISLLGASFSSSVIVYLLRSYWKKGPQDYALTLIIKLVQVIIWGLFIVTLLDNFIQIDALIAGLGIGGIAIGFAAQAILQDLFSYFSIFLDRPFEINDFIIIDDYMGTVEHIGIKTTRLRSISGEQLIFSNSDLTSSRVRNLKRMESRRVLFTLGVTYETTFEKLKEIPDIIKNIILKLDEVTFDRVHFSTYGDFSLNFEIVYYIADRDYNKYMDIQQEINFKIKEEFDKQSIEFAYPTQTLFLNNLKTPE
jgi:small-conductance mechanosensitive channel